MVYKGHDGYMSIKNLHEGWDALIGEEPNCMLVSPSGVTENTIISDVNLYTDTILEYTVILGVQTGDFYIGNFGVNTTTSYNDNNDFRWFAPVGWGNTLSDVGVDRTYVNIDIRPYLSTKIHIKQSPTNTTISLPDGAVLNSTNYSNRGFSNGGANLQISTHEGFKIFDIKVTKNNVVVFDAIVKTHGLFDKVSNQYISTPNWTVMAEA